MHACKCTESLNCKLHLRLVILKMLWPLVIRYLRWMLIPCVNRGQCALWRCDLLNRLVKTWQGFHTMIRQRYLYFDCRCNCSPGLEQSVTPFTGWKQKPDMGWVLLVLGCNSEFRFHSGLAVWRCVLPACVNERVERESPLDSRGENLLCYCLESNSMSVLRSYHCVCHICVS